MEAIIFLTLNFVMITFLISSFVFKYEFDFVFLILSGLTALFLALNVSTLELVGNAMLVMIYLTYMLGVSALSIIKIMDSMSRD